MTLTTTTQVSVDGVMRGNGGPDENRRGGFEHGGWARPPRPLFDNEAMTCVHENELVDEINLLIVPVVVGQGMRLFPDTGPDIALDLVDSRAFPKGVTIQIYRPAGRPQFASAAADRG